MPASLIHGLMAFFDVVKSPIAVRSSSLLEDSHYQPFAGIYSTYMVPRLEDKYEMLRLLSDAIKAVYASVFYRDSKAYMTATSNLIDQEKMAIVLQEVVGNRYNDHFYPTISGVARSLNFYPKTVLPISIWAWVNILWTAVRHCVSLRAIRTVSCR